LRVLKRGTVVRRQIAERDIHTEDEVVDRHHAVAAAVADALCLRGATLGEAHRDEHENTQTAQQRTDNAP